MGFKKKTTERHNLKELIDVIYHLSHLSYSTKDGEEEVEVVAYADGDDQQSGAEDDDSDSPGVTAARGVGGHPHRRPHGSQSAGQQGRPRKQHTSIRLRGRRRRRHAHGHDTRQEADQEQRRGDVLVAEEAGAHGDRRRTLVPDEAAVALSHGAAARGLGRHRPN